MFFQANTHTGWVPDITLNPQTLTRSQSHWALDCYWNQATLPRETKALSYFLSHHFTELSGYHPSTAVRINPTVFISVDSEFATKTKTSASRQNLSIQISSSVVTSVPGLMGRSKYYIMFVKKQNLGYRLKNKKLFYHLRSKRKKFSQPSIRCLENFNPMFFDKTSNMINTSIFHILMLEKKYQQ